MPEEFYRGGSRSPFKAAVWGGALLANSAGASTTMLTVQGNTMERLKRVQVVCMIQKAATQGSLDAGWLAFYREDSDTSTSVSGLEVSNPQVLRPKPFVNNLDHAVYLDMYLEAITLDAGSKLHIMGKVIGSGTGGVPIVFSAKWYSESSLR